MRHGKCFPWKMSLSFAEKRPYPRWVPSWLGRGPRCWSFSKSGCSIILSVSREEDVPTVQSRECPPHCGVPYWELFSSFLPSSLQMRNFPNSMLAETPLGVLVEERWQILNVWPGRDGKWALKRSDGAYLERALGISGTFRSNEKASFNHFLVLGDHSLRAADSEVSLQFTKILIKLLRSLVGYVRACKQVGIGWEWNPDSLCPRALFTRLSFLADALHVTHIYNVQSEPTHPSKWRNVSRPAVT